ncbi:sugar ABC transporter permease [Paenibacillus sp. Soil766]|uniref:ABC transporter permease n=1 Tax=Paenibacillus sp. Soil766 TaxID=1736404 RepID=UPI00070A9424|nr:ABC transporter permease subunit [Paenibacillus sp. Soil766]KRF03609.1 sugar ABC transporter permease [Paenibacillus sp. Soil766]
MNIENAAVDVAKSRPKVSGISRKKLKKRLLNEYHLYLMFIPVLVYYALFKYVPMLGAIVLSFLDYDIFKGFANSHFVGVKHFVAFFESVYFLRLLKNTLLLNLMNLLFVFPAPIVFALLINEVRSRVVKRTVQTVSYLPHFVSTVIVASMAVTFLSPSVGMFNNMIASFGMERIHFLMKPEYFKWIYTSIDSWQTIGWSAILYFAALTGINSELYEAAMVDGASRWKQTIHITIPGIASTIIILLLLKIGHMLEVGYELILLLYNPTTYATADVINTYVYRKGIIDSSYSFASAIGLFQSIIGLILIVSANRLARKYSETSMW